MQSFRNKIHIVGSDFFYSKYMSHHSHFFLLHIWSIRCFVVNFDVIFAVKYLLFLFFIFFSLHLRLLLPRFPRMLSKCLSLLFQLLQEQNTLRFATRSQQPSRENQSRKETMLLPGLPDTAARRKTKILPPLPGLLNMVARRSIRTSGMNIYLCITYTTHIVIYVCLHSLATIFVESQRPMREAAGCSTIWIYMHYMNIYAL